MAFSGYPKETLKYFDFEVRESVCIVHPAGGQRLNSYRPVAVVWTDDEPSHDLWAVSVDTGLGWQLLGTTSRKEWVWTPTSGDRYASLSFKVEAV